MSIASLESYLEENYATFKESASVVAQSDKRAKNLISSDHKLYNFDKISEAIYSTNSKSCSVDGLRVNDGFLEFIEFKTGFLRRLTRENWTPEIGTCDYKKGICDEYWKLYWKLDKKEREELIDSIKDKAIESFITYEKHIFLRLSEHDRIPLRLIAVIDGNSIDEYEDVLASLAKKPTTATNCVSCVRDALNKLRNRSDANDIPYFFDDIVVCTFRDFQEQLDKTDA